MIVTLEDWRNSGWLVQHEPDAEEIAGFMALADRDIHDAQSRELSEDWQFNIAYNAALQLAIAALAASGYRVDRGGAHHHHAVQSLAHTLELDAETVRLFDRFRKKRNVSEYDSVGTITRQEAKEMLALATRLREQLAAWLRSKHPRLLPDGW